MNKDIQATSLGNLTEGKDMATICKCCQDLANHVVTLMNNNQRYQARHCISSVQEIYETTPSPAVKGTIENIFIYNLGAHLMLQHSDHHVDAMFPDCFLEVLKMQIIGSNI